MKDFRCCVIVYFIECNWPNSLILVCSVAVIAPGVYHDCHSCIQLSEVEIVEFDLSVGFAIWTNNVYSSDDWWRMIVNLEASSASVMSRRWSLSSFDTCISWSEQNLLEKTHSLWQIPILNRTQVSTRPSVYHINDMMVYKYCSTTSRTFSLRSCMISIRCFRSHFTTGMWKVRLSISGDSKC